MPYTLRFELNLELSDGLPLPKARLWLDTSQDMALDDGEEIPMTSVDLANWIGTRAFESQETLQDCFFVLRFVAPAGTKWRIKAICDEKVFYEVKNPQKTLRNRETVTGFLKAPRSGLRP